MKKKDDLTKSKYIENPIEINLWFILACPLKSHFYNGSCYFYLPPKKVDKELKNVQIYWTIDEGRRFSKSKLIIFFV
jgi:hypothetical protein